MSVVARLLGIPTQLTLIVAPNTHGKNKYLIYTKVPSEMYHFDSHWQVTYVPENQVEEAKDPMIPIYICSLAQKICDAFGPNCQRITIMYDGQYRLPQYILKSPLNQQLKKEKAKVQHENMITLFIFIGLFWFVFYYITR
jgi:hypothetical protein